MAYPSEKADLTKDLMDSTAEAAERASDAARKTASDAAMSAQDAIAEMKRIMTELVERTGARATEAIGESGEQAAERFNAIVDEVQELGKDSLDRLSDAIARRPVATLAAAAGVGLLIGLASRAAPRPRK